MKYILLLVFACSLAFGQGQNPTFGGGGGSGTVNTCAAPGNAFYAGAGTVVGCDTSVTDNGSGTLNMKVLGLTGATSGTATLTPPSVAGTATNPVVSTNIVQAPAGAATTPSFEAGAGGIGIWGPGASELGLASNNTDSVRILNNQIWLSGASGNYCFSSGAISAATDTCSSRIGPGVQAFGNSSVGDESGLVRWNTCKVSSDITLTVNTNITVCTWSLPAVAKTWAWQCKIPWVISAGTGTNTLSIGVNASQAPTTTTTVSANIYTTNTGTQTAANVNLSASGALNVLTSPTITPGATVFQSETSGTLAASATAGTFTITMNAAGTTATAAAKAGATCVIY